MVLFRQDHCIFSLWARYYHPEARTTNSGVMNFTLFIVITHSILLTLGLRVLIFTVCSPKLSSELQLKGNHFYNFNTDHYTQCNYICNYTLWFDFLDVLKKIILVHIHNIILMTPPYNPNQTVDPAAYKFQNFDRDFHAPEVPSLFPRCSEMEKNFKHLLYFHCIIHIVLLKGWRVMKFKFGRLLHNQQSDQYYMSIICINSFSSSCRGVIHKW